MNNIDLDTSMAYKNFISFRLKKRELETLCKPQIEMSAFKSTLLRLSKRTVYIINAEIKNLDHNHDLAAFQVHKFALRHRFEESA